MSIHTKLLCLGTLTGVVYVIFGMFSLENVKVGYQKIEFQKILKYALSFISRLHVLS